MHSLAKKLMMARKLSFGEDGVAELLDNDVFLMYGSMLFHLQDKAGDDVSYDIGRELGHSIVDDIKKMGLSGTKMIDFIMDLLTMKGLGEFQVEKFDLKSKKGEVWVKNNIVLREAEKAKKKQVKNTFIEGLLAGVFSKNYGLEIACKEIACVSGSNKLCRFSLKTG